MTANKTFLILLLADVSYTAYNAVAVSENFAISTTIDHEVTLGSFRAASADDLTVTGDINIGTITINPADGYGEVWYDSAGNVSRLEGGVIAATKATFGTFTANVEHPELCEGNNSACAGLSTPDNGYIFDVFGGGGNTHSSYCDSNLKYSGEGKVFYRVLRYCRYADPQYAPAGVYTSYTTITLDLP
ncbi:MAG: hypothetical protein IJ689_06290 [Alphaproteobacteria bacterium]|nr:hypothetical protein [Alphaproteobacteria bacterium]